MTIEIETVEIEDTVRKIRDEINTRIKTSALKPTHQKKFVDWLQNLNQIQDQILEIKKVVLPLIKKDLRYSFTNKNLIITAMVQPSLKNTIDEIKVHFHNEPDFEMFNDELTKLGTCPETAKSLAWIGDTVIKFAILKQIWKPRITSEELHNTRKSLENNKNLSDLCDRWKLYEHRIHFDDSDKIPQPNTLLKNKGTLVESMYGIIFIEKKIKGVQKAIHLIDPSIN
jgi:dsRNA-specific ribonuclease